MTEPIPAKRQRVSRSRSKVRPLLGWREWVELPDLSPIPLKAKIDTGARTSTLHAFGMKRHDRDGAAWVTFEVHPVQRSQAHSTLVSYPVEGLRRVRSSSGHSEERPVIRTPVRIGEHQFEIDVTLTSRDEMGFRMLLGRAAIRRRFLVDAGRSYIHHAAVDRPQTEQKESDGT
ncbi:MAG: ATP-dependent zinc protease [Acidimicrobiia bacterium]|nr:ATP-dependent zinc protease [Acidimicrobiia bacterium]